MAKMAQVQVMTFGSFRCNIWTRLTLPCNHTSYSAVSKGARALSEVKRSHASRGGHAPLELVQSALFRVVSKVSALYITEMFLINPFIIIFCSSGGHAQVRSISKFRS